MRTFEFWESKFQALALEGGLGAAAARRARHQRHCRGRRIMSIFCVAAADQSESDGPRGEPIVRSSLSP